MGRNGYARQVLIAVAVCGGLADARMLQAQRATSYRLVVQPDARGCLTEGALRARVDHWLSASSEVAPVTVRVKAGTRPVSFTVVRDGVAVAERVFSVLPTRCRDRVDAVALAVALALEGSAPPRAEPTPGPPQTQARVEGAAVAAPEASERATGGVREAARMENAGYGSGREPARSSAEASVARDRNAVATTRDDAAASGAEASSGAAPARPPLIPGEPSRAESSSVLSSLPVPRPPASTRARARSSVPPRAPAPPLQEEPAAPEREQMPSPEPASQSAVDPWLELSAGPSWLVDVLPREVAALQLGVEAPVAPFWRVGVQGFATDRTNFALAGGRSRTRLIGGRAFVCVHTLDTELALATCLGLAAGAARAAGEGYAVPAPPVSLGWLAGFVRGSVSIPGSSTVGLRVSIDGMVHAVRPAVRVQGALPSEAVAGWIGAAGSVELVVRLR